MNKAFIKEDDFQEDDEDLPRTPVLEGDKNYITPAGLESLKQRYKQLKYSERPAVVKTVAWAAENGDRSENADYTYGKKKLRQIDKELGFLGRKIRTAHVIDPATITYDYVAFGATVKILTEDDQEKQYTIVGADEVDIAKGKISWISPLAKALINAKQGDTIQFRSPKGIQEVEIVSISYHSST